MPVTTKLKIWTPDESEVEASDVNMAAMSASIENEVGPRLELQEKAIGLKAGFTSAPSLNTTMTIAVMTINETNGSFEQGLDIAAGIVTIETPGMYIVSGAVGIENISGHTAKMDIRKGGTILVADEVESNSAFFQAAKATTVVNCIAGDTLSMRIGDARGGAKVSSRLELSHFTVAMIQAVPV